MKKILLVEDEIELRDNIRLLLESEGYKVTLAENGLDALKVIEKDNPDLIISDIMMPFMNGYELFDTVKEDLKTKIIPFIFLTAKSDKHSIRYGMNLGADDYLTKPFTQEDLLQSVKTRFDKSEALSNRIDEIRNNISKYIPHELRTPLVSILGFSEIIVADIDTLEKDDILHMVCNIIFGAKRLHKRIEKFIELIGLERIKNNQWVTDNQKSDINESVIKQIILDDNIIEERKEKIESHIEVAELKIPDYYLKILISELLENAVKFSEPDKPVIVEGKKTGKFYELNVKDSGRGMKDYEISHIDAFQQFDREKYQQEGNGLGLAIVKKILDKCSGNIDIQSEKYRFTKVKIFIPIIQ